MVVTQEAGNGRHGASFGSERGELHADASPALKRLRFRNYTPRDDGLKAYCEDMERVEDLCAHLRAEQDELLANCAVRFASPALDTDNIVPKKANWDLKQDLAPKLERLERRTQRALLELAQELARMQRETTGSNDGNMLARAVGKAELVASDNDEDS